MIRPKIGCYAVYEPAEEGWENASAQLKTVCDCLRKAGLDVIEAPGPVFDEASCKSVGDLFKEKDIDILHPLIITWSFDHYTYYIHQQIGVPVAVRSIPGIRTGSLVGGQQLGCLLTDLDIEHKLFYGPAGDDGVCSDVAVYAKACAIKKDLKRTKFLVLGRRTHGMTPTAFDEVEIMRLFGSSVVTLGLDELQAYASDISEDLVKDIWERVSCNAAAVNCTCENGLMAVRNYLGIKKVVQERGISSIAIGSYPYCQGTLCLAAALLNEDGIAVGCEGDMNSTIAMYILSKISDMPVHFGEMLEIDEAQNTIISSHCGAAAPSLASSEGYLLCPVRLANTGVCIRYKSRTGPVTYVNLVGRKQNYRMCAFEGQAVETEMVFEGNPMKIKLTTPVNKVLEHVSVHGFGHHWMAAYGHVAPVLKELCRITGIKGVFPDYI